MKRAVASAQTWWIRLFVLAVVASTVVPAPRLLELGLIAALFALGLVRPPRADRPPTDLAPPVRGRWVVLNSPGTAVPSHGVKAYGQTYAVDILRPSPDAATSIGWSWRTRRPETYPCFGEPVRAMAAGTVVRSTDRQRDHRSRDTWPTLISMMTVEAFARELGGAPFILGNHVIVEHDDGTFAAYAHLRHRSTRVRPGDRVATGDHLGDVGNTGNTSEPHLHVQLMDRARVTAAAGLPMHWPDAATDEQKDPRWSTGKPKPTALPTFPQNGQIIQA
ncbi:M23 family metallopeptidase [Actinoplanes sp. TRM 88003]|uniref:M23 family metallopeptidase n=1 Tax=Paractinoplanes aksuensis TaxID=2939490 RepID=A0ABT1DSM2_9ACTN|nr:M23 family metallopeptidase [Actinoplanes aksuensis]MCO8273845.1 M23 family metallopeptidase [Actinoplanes aksuensis]